MSSNVYRKTEVVGSSPDSVEDAIRNGVQRASRTVRNVTDACTRAGEGPAGRPRHGRRPPG